MANITLKVSGKITVDQRAMAEAVAPEVIRTTLERMARGRDVADASFRGYSSLYMRQLAAIGRASRPDVALTGSMAKDVRLNKLTMRAGLVRMHFGPTRGVRSEPVQRPPPWIFSKDKTPAQQARALEKWRAAKKRKPRALTHAKLWSIHRHAYRGRAARVFMGISPSQRPRIAGAMERARIFRST